MRSQPRVVGPVLPIVGVLRAARQRFADMVENRFSDYANESLLWQDRAKHISSPIKETDPASVRFAKHSLQAMVALEKMVAEINRIGEKGFTPRAGDNLTSFYELLQVFYSDFIHIGVLI